MAAFFITNCSSPHAFIELNNSFCIHEGIGQCNNSGTIVGIEVSMHFDPIFKFSCNRLFIMQAKSRTRISKSVFHVLSCCQITPRLFVSVCRCSREMRTHTWRSWGLSRPPSSPSEFDSFRSASIRALYAWEWKCTDATGKVTWIACRFCPLLLLCWKKKTKRKQGWMACTLFKGEVTWAKTMSS